MDADNRLRERALALPLLGLLLLSPPVLAMFGRAVYLAGIPLSYAYVFTVWLGLIALGAVLARRLPDGEPADTAQAQPGASAARERAAPDAPVGD